MSFFKAIFGICNSPKLDESLWRYEGGSIFLDEIAFDKQNVVGVYMKGQCLPDPVLLYRGDDGVLRAARNVCPHAKRKIDPLPGSSKLRCCSVSHSDFGYDGKKINGPANDNLVVYSVKSENGKIQIPVK